MIRAVKEPSHAKSDSLILAARVMAFYEVYSPVRAKSLAHSDENIVLASLWP